jgi:hypothetical protein
MGLGSVRRFSRVIPNHERTSRGSEEDGPSTIASTRTGSVGASESSMDLTVDVNQDG